MLLGIALRFMGLTFILVGGFCFLVGGGCSTIVAYNFAATHDPHYTPGSAANAGVCVAVALLALALRFVHIRENKKFEAAERDDVIQLDIVGGDRRARGFRYVY
jgi:hypothetical protein